ncbi:glycosyl transferase family protein [Oceanicoccus sagamiensis]|uniref:Glycosyl transferase n=1 Tax=Oceanicoccus sagamiensis TaxID=716816 RepID=A0A1X9NGK3_9GAMM|nr:glycosyl transferase family protein [Oceanicoccus sagamiensis]ARN75522.1 glycosyl transferase [Oceanicoccus sagamiensis]
MSEQYRNTLSQIKNGEHPFAHYVRILGKGKTGSRSLTEQEAFDAMQMILKGDVEDLQLGAFLMLLRVKEESHEELTGFVAAAREHIAAPKAVNVQLDWSSYAGKKKQLPWYLLSCFAIADQGIPVYMHGASGHTEGRLYTEQVLTALGITPAQDWPMVEQQLNTQCFSFMPLEFLCPPLKRIIDFRHYLGLRSPVHTLSRLLNPLAAPYSMQSIFHPAYGDSHQQAAISLGQSHAAVFKGEGGEIERRPEASCLVKTVIDGVAGEESWPKMLEGRQALAETLDIDHLTAVWRGDAEDAYGRDAIIGTLAISIRLMQKADDQSSAFSLAKQWWLERDRNRL